MLLRLPARERRPRLHGLEAPWPYTSKNVNVNRDARGKTIIRAQQTFVAQIPTADGLMYLWMGDRWDSHPDDVMMGHDFQYWAPLRFDAAGGIEPLKWVGEWKVNIKTRSEGPSASQHGA